MGRGGCIPRAELTKSMLNVRLRDYVSQLAVRVLWFEERLTLIPRLLGRCHWHIKLVCVGIRKG